MAATTKLSFRARNPDANRPTSVYYADELHDLSECAPISRAVTQMPTGMEKEEELVMLFVFFSGIHILSRALSLLSPNQ